MTKLQLVKNIIKNEFPYPTMIPKTQLDNVLYWESNDDDLIVGDKYMIKLGYNKINISNSTSPLYIWLKNEDDSNDS